MIIFSNGSLFIVLAGTVFFKRSEFLVFFSSWCFCGSYEIRFYVVVARRSVVSFYCLRDRVFVVGFMGVS